ncbi:hypothetical protein FLM55_03375 [Francisella sp. Scap27]|uniref:hypothetical protein n=1 Tax=Francisella sp. Scap27 TaxID=2589986 RepID=UPI0015BDAA10|nr:hypothetical protein [Francisella sp. Scap27]QLE78831.1 hypothetical protein FLM55_03375 [Francisella sp. Scap27]
MKKHDLKFCFKGNRKYVHGTDIFNQVCGMFDIDFEGMDVSFHGISERNLSISKVMPDNKDDIKFVFKLKDSQHTYIYYGFENNIDINCKYEYDESIICKASNIVMQKKEIILSKITGYSFIENIVALNKHLLENIYLDAHGKWYFSRLQLNKAIVSDGEIKLCFRSNFNFKLIKTEIFIDNISVGFIYFSLV